MFKISTLGPRHTRHSVFIITFMIVQSDSIKRRALYILKDEVNFSKDFVLKNMMSQIDRIKKKKMSREVFFVQLSHGA